MSNGKIILSATRAVDTKLYMLVVKELTELQFVFVHFVNSLLLNHLLIYLFIYLFIYLLLLRFF